MLFRALGASLKLSAEEKRVLRSFARALSDRVVNGRFYTCVITDDAELRRLNSVFLGHDYATDVLSFPSANATGGLGEIAISVERAESQAREFGHGRSEEIQILMLHGLLHLAGMDHECDAGEMGQAERKWRAEFDLPSNLISRALNARPAR